MTTKELISNISSRTGIKPVDVKVVLEELGYVVFDCIKDEKIPLMGIGSFQSKVREARVVRNPQDGSEIKLSKRTVPVFKFSPNTKKLLTVEV